jgi:hypothetical protein
MRRKSCLNLKLKDRVFRDKSAAGKAHRRTATLEPGAITFRGGILQPLQLEVLLLP